jgi:hypothetical protein
MNQPVWNTVAGSLGNYPSATVFSYQLSATPQLPAVTLTYSIISGSLPNGLTMNMTGLISGTPTLVIVDTTSTFVVRATDNYGNIRDRTFSLTLSGSAVPEFTTPGGSIATLLDSTWTEIPILYNNPIPNNPVVIRRIAGTLPPGLEINEFGLIRGYAAPPETDVNLISVVTYVIATTQSNNTLTCLSTANIVPGRPVIFSGTTFGSIEAGQTYYVKSVLSGTQFTISYTVNGSVVAMDDAVGYMITTLPNITVGQPTNQSYSFTLKLESPLGTDTQLYSMEIINQNTPVSQGGPGNPPNNRIPTVLNTRPETYMLDNNPAYGYYVIPPNSNGYTYNPNDSAYIGSFASDDQFAFKVLGHDFDGNDLTYNFSSIPPGLFGDPVTGWITGNPIISDDSISVFNFSVYVSKVISSGIVSATFNFSFKITSTINGNIVWITPADMGTVFNGMTSIEYVKAVSDVPLQYRLAVGSVLPPNLELLDTGELSGIVSFQPTETIQTPNTSTAFTFTIEAYSPKFSSVISSKEFTLAVYQEFGRPFDTLYCKCTPSVSDRNLLATLLNDDALIPTDYLYRADDPFFGKATSVIYDHAYGIYASDLEAYTAAIREKNHYWRSVVLGEIKTAIARDETTGEILYEVVYSEVIDNLVNYGEMDKYSNKSQSNIRNPQGESVSKEVYWPRPIPLFLGPWYTSETDIFASYEGENSPPPSYYTSLTPGFARILYPNSLPNMRQQVVDVLGQDYNYKLLPLWMTSQQRNGSTLGYTPGWVIAYCKPEIVTVPTLTVTSCNNTAFTLGPNEVTDNLSVGDLITFNSNIVFGSIAQGQNYYIHSIPNSTSFTISRKIGGPIIVLTPGSGTMTVQPYATITLPDGTITNTPTYAEYIQYQIQNEWKNEVGQVQTLNTINFELDRFTVNKSATYNFDNNLLPATWTVLPGATPTPNPIDSKDFYVLFPRETILPDETQYRQ